MSAQIRLPILPNVVIRFVCVPLDIHKLVSRRQFAAFPNVESIHLVPHQCSEQGKVCQVERVFLWKDNVQLKRFRVEFKAKSYIHHREIFIFLSQSVRRDVNIWICSHKIREFESKQTLWSSQLNASSLIFGIKSNHWGSDVLIIYATRVHL